MSSIVPVGDTLPGFIAKDGKVLPAKLIGADPDSMRVVVLFEEDNIMFVSDDYFFFTKRFAAELAAGEV